MKYRLKRCITGIMMITLAIMMFELSFAGSCEVKAAQASEYRAFWLSYYDFSAYRSAYPQRNASTFRTWFSGVAKNGRNLGMNTIIVQVRPFSDALYQSRYYPWSAVISGKQGTNPGFDPLRIMTQVAHQEGLRIEAWVNPYRVTSSSTNYYALARNNPARKWHANKSTRRNVLSYRGQLYYNPSKKSVRTLIVNGVQEIAANYDVDGIHMDDYFYPSFGYGNVRTAFDAREYNKSAEKKQGVSIADYRRKQVNTLVKRIYQAVKATKPGVTFGISPAGDPSELTSDYAHYVDYRTWLSSSSYIDYICPQIYWGFKHTNCQFDKITRKWVSAAQGSPVKLYLGIAVYKSGHNVGSNSREKKEWKSDANVLKKQIAYGRNKNVDGFAFFDYSDLISKASKNAVKKMKTELNK